MILNKVIRRFLGASVGTCALLARLADPALSMDRDDALTVPKLIASSSSENGIWRTRTQLVFDSTQHALMRRIYEVWDPAPSQNLDFFWMPDSLVKDTEGKVSGAGRLIWRFRGAPTYDRTSIFAEYRGLMKDGRPDGRGTYSDFSGIVYQGEWKNGLIDGLGTIRWPGGAEYIGDLRDGKVSGRGRYIDVTGEIFDGDFIDGSRHGIGTTTLPNGNSYRSNWIMGKELEDSRSLRFAQLSGPAVNVTSDIRIGISVDSTKMREGDLVYAASSEGARLVIQPDSRRLMEMWKGGGEIQMTEGEENSFGVFSISKEQMFPLILVFEVQNRSTAPIAISGSYLAVESSITDLQPAIQLRHERQNNCASEYKPRFQAQNYGWGAAEDPVLRFTFTDSSGNNAGPSFTKKVGRIGRDHLDIDLGSELQSAGVNTQGLRRKGAFVCASRTPSQCLQEIRATGLFGPLAPRIGLSLSEIFILAAGTLDYTWTDSQGQARARSSPFRVKVPLGYVYDPGACAEMSMRELIASKPLKFQLDQFNYRLPISFQRNVPVGQTSRFAIVLSAAKSSSHAFSVVLQLADGREISSRPISLLFYVPQGAEREGEGKTVNLEDLKVPTLWKHNGSTLKLTAEGTSRTFVYDVPRPALKTLGVDKGTVLFSGEKSNNSYSGTAHVFTKSCGPQPYDVNGPVSGDQRTVTLYGRAPILDSACNIASYRDDVLIFTFAGD